MIKCETCLSRTNCQFIAKHNNVQVEGCTAFRDEEAYVAKIKSEAIKEFAERVNATTWYRINTKGELVVGANSETDVPLYKAEDIYKIAKEMGVE